MPKSVLMERQVKKSRKTLQTLQVSADEQMLTGNNLVLSNDKILSSKKKQSKAVDKVVVADKENTPILRRSKRRITVSDGAKNNTDLPVNPKVRKPSGKNVKVYKNKLKSIPETLKECSTGDISEDKTNLSRNALNFPPPTLVTEDEDISQSKNNNQNLLITSPSGVTEDSGFESSSRVSDQSFAQSSVIFHSPVTNHSTTNENKYSILTCETAPLSYWKDLAEQRRIDLEKALQENESVHEQLAVLEEENSQLKEILKQAEEVARIVKDMNL